MSFTKSVVLLLSAFACVQALTTPHARDAHHHRALAARVAAPVSNVAVPDILPKKRDASKRSSSKRCAARPAPSSNSTVAASSSSAAPSASAPAPVNVGSNPTGIISSVLNPAPTPSSTPAPSPTPTPTPTQQPAPSSSSQAPAPPAPSSGSGSGSGVPDGFLAGTNSGDGTWYAPGLGACGITNSDSDFICAVSEQLFDVYPGYNGANPNNNPVCGKQIKATYQGASITVTVTDRCTACSQTSLDFTPDAFDALTNNNPGLGRIPITWEWI